MQSDSAAKKPVEPVRISPSNPDGKTLATAQKTEAMSHTEASPTKNKNKPVDKLATRSELYLAMGVILFYVILFLTGRRYWDERYYIAEEGLGYFLGISGGIIMLLAMAYSAFKYAPSLRKKIKLKAWLNIHIIFGLLGPALIYFHSTFRIGSFNGGIALTSMSLVLLSGIIGRYLYSKTHYGLGGQKAKLGELHKILNDENNHFHSEKLNNFTKNVMKHSTTLLQASWELISYGIHSRWIYFRVSREMFAKLQEISVKKNFTKKEIKKHRRSIKKNLWSYLVLLHKVALFKLYERFFAFWRNAHAPLLYLMLISGIVHVIAVHLYSS
ncbi:hypothetical protein [Kaarinaea lacus]